MSKSKYRAFTLQTKLDILREVDKKEKSKTAIAAHFGIPKSTLSTIIKDRKRIEEGNMKGLGLNTKRMRSAAYPKLEEALVVWLKNLRSKNIPVDGNMLKTKAEDFALRMGIEDGIKFSDGWVQNFKKRFNLTFRKVCGESGEADSVAAKSWANGRLKEILSEYEPDDIYNADETGLFYKVLPNRTLTVKNERCSGGKLSKLRVTILLAANMTGNDKHKLFVIGKAKKPRCFKGIKSLPVKYEANSNSWMTEELFVSWIKQFDRRMAGEKRNVILIIDNCTAHPSNINGLTNVKLEFLPPNVTSLIQPMDQGIIQCFKRLYKKMLLQRMLINIENGKEYSVDLLKAAYMAAAAWDAVSAQTIQNCFRHVGFASAVEATAPVPTSASAAKATAPASTSASAADAIAHASTSAEVDDGDECSENLLEELKRKDSSIPSSLSFNEFVDLDTAIECSEDITDDGILQKVTGPPENDSSDEEELPVISARPSIQATTEALDVIRRYLQEEPEMDEFLKMTVVLEKKVLSLASKNLVQKKVTDFFS